MLQRFFFVFVCLVLSGCISRREEGPTPCQTHISKTAEQRRAPTDPIVKLLPRDERIVGVGRAHAEQMARYLTQNNKRLSYRQALRYAHTYIKESAYEGINHDIAFAQMCHETRCLRFGNLVQPEQNNFAGIGATGPGSPGHSFPTLEIGVRAQIQHLKAYASTAPLRQVKVDPRFDRVAPRGKAPTIYQLSGTWAADRRYHEGLKRHLSRLLAQK